MFGIFARPNRPKQRADHNPADGTEFDGGSPDLLMVTSGAVTAVIISIPIAFALTYLLMHMLELGLWWALPIYSAIGVFCTGGIVGIRLLWRFFRE